ncbi:MAG: NUDIX domain-containing protein [Candidatus Levyibacteriota bacterium]
MLPTRAVAVIIHNNTVLLMERMSTGKEYFTFPGGGVEDDETVEQAVIREVKEETSLEVKIEKLIYKHFYNDNFKGRSNQYFYLCSYISGVPMLGEANEKEEMKLGKEFYKPQWMPVSQLSSLLLYPLEIKDWLIEDINNNFVNPPREATLSVKELRETL